MKINKPIEIIDLIKRWNDADDVLTRYAIANALRSGLMSYVTMIDDTILPVYKSAMIEHIKRKG